MWVRTLLLARQLPVEVPAEPLAVVHPATPLARRLGTVPQRLRLVWGGRVTMQIA